MCEHSELAEIKLIERYLISNLDLRSRGLVPAAWMILHIYICRVYGAAIDLTKFGQLGSSNFA